jgi:hypothetical protein
VRRTLVPLAVATLLSLTGCSGDDPPGAAPTSSSPTATASASNSSSSASEPTPASGLVVDITFEGDSVTPNGERVEAKVGQPITLRVTADEGGALHVHSSPERELEYDAGTTVLTLTIKRPGVVDVESHDLGVVVLQIEVRPFPS